MTERAPCSWRWFLATAVLLGGVYFAVPSPVGKLIISGLAGLASVAAILVGVRRHRPPRRLPWLLFAAGQAAFTIGALIFYGNDYLLHRELPLPSVADAFYLAAYPFLIAGLVLLARGRDSRRDRAGLVDALIVTVSMCVLSWVFLMAPYVHDPGLSTGARLTSLAYSLADVLVLGVAARLWTDRGRRNTAFALLTGSLVPLLVADTCYGLLQLRHSWSVAGPADLGWLAFYMCFGAAALHPSMRDVDRPTRAPRGKITRARFGLLLALASLLSPLVLGIQAMRGEPVDTPVVVAGSVALLVLALIRMDGLVVALEAVHRRQGETRVRRLVQNASDLITICDLDTTIRYQTSSLTRVLGWQPRELIGTRLIELVHPDDRERMRSMLAGIGEDRPGDPVECRLRRNDGSTIIAETIAATADDDNVRSLVLTTRDITDRKRAEEALIENRRQLVQAQRIARVGNWTWELASDEISGSEEFYRIFGVEPDTHLNVAEVVQSFVHADDLAAVQALVARMPQDPSAYEIEARMVRADGVARVLLCRGEGIRDESGRVVRVVGTNQDITERKLAGEALRVSEERFRGVTEASMDAIISTDSAGRLRSWNRGAEQIFGWAAAEVLGQPLSLVLPEQLPGAHDECMARLVETGGTELTTDPMEHTARRRDGSRFPVELTVGAWTSSEGIALSAVIRDITDRKALEQQLIHRAFHDDLTGLANRALFVDRLQHVLAQRTGGDPPLAVLMLDLDDFKDVNDSLGHRAGDDLLCSVAGRVQDCLRTGDTVARLGGDEFALLLDPLGDARGATGVAERVLRALAEPFVVLGQQVQLSASIGIAFADPDHAPAADEMLRNADMAMYVAKRKNKGHYECFAPSMHAGLVRKLELAADLRRSAAAGEFAVHYQPIVELAGGHLVGVEALVRWQHPRHGMMSPAEFIPLAEETGLIVPIGHQVLAEACRRAAGWRRDFPATALTVNVNLSVRQVQDPDLVTQVTRILNVTGLTPSALTLEITESVLAEDSTYAAERLWALKELGVRLAVDDFGTGYSSLSRLRQFPIDSLKIPKPFVDGILHGPEDSALARAIIELADTLGLQVVAEGIERHDQWIELNKLGCELGQGFYFARPVTADRIDALLCRDRLADPRSPRTRFSREAAAPTARGRDRATPRG